MEHDGESIERTRVRAHAAERAVERSDVLAVEEPLAVRIRAEDGPAEPFLTTMRTPGHDRELAAGLLFTEGVLRAPAELLELVRPADPRLAPELVANTIVATLVPAAFARAQESARPRAASSACGVCGKLSIETALGADARPLSSGLALAPEFLYGLPERLRPRQSVFAETGGLHAAAWFDARGELRAHFEDIGRHNATDKLVGALFLARALPAGDGVLLVSGRAGFEIVHKAYAAGMPCLASVSAPSSLAVELAEAAGITLVGFLRGRRFNVYAHPGRVR